MALSHFGTYTTTENILCTFCNKASLLCSEKIDFVLNNFLHHYFDVPFNSDLEMDLDGTFNLPVFHVCSECLYLFQEIQRLSSIWVEVQAHLFDNLLPEIHRRIELKEVERQLQKYNQCYKEALFSVVLRQKILNLFGSIPDALDSKRKAEKVGQFLPVRVTKLADTFPTNKTPPPVSNQISFPEIKIESDEWTVRHHHADVVTLVYTHIAHCLETPSGTENTFMPPDDEISSLSQTLEYAIDLELDDPDDNPIENIDIDFDHFFSEVVGNGIKPFEENTEAQIPASKGKSKSKKIDQEKPLKYIKEKKTRRPKVPKEKKTRKPKPSYQPAPPRQQIQCKFCPLVLFFPHTYRLHEQTIHKNYLNHRCQECPEIFSEESFLTAHEVSHITDPDVKVWTCTICNKKCFTPYDLHKHIINVHIPEFIEGTVVARNNELKEGQQCLCAVCSKQFSSFHILAKHMNLHFKKVLQCDICFDKTGFKTNTDEANVMISHLYKAHPNEPEQFPCPTCGNLYKYRFVLNRHMEYHSLEEFKPLECIYCCIRFSKDEGAALENHQLTCTNEVTETASHQLPHDLKCSECSRTFPRGKDFLLARHELSHDELLVHECTVPDCDCKFTRKSFLETHMKIHSKGPFQCTICPSILLSADALEKHLKELHTGEKTVKCSHPGCTELFVHRSTMIYHKTKYHNLGKRYSCDFCKKEFLKKNYLDLHMLRLHPDECPEPPEKHECNSCGAEFIYNDLQKHMKRVHGGERFKPKRKKCEICEKVMNARNFEMHQNLHKGERPYSCTKCDKTFIWKNNYQNHMKSHATQRPHKCDECSSSFVLPNHLKLHKLRAHPTDSDGVRIPRPPRKVSKRKPKAKKKNEEVEETETEESEEEKEDFLEENEAVVLKPTKSKKNTDEELLILNEIRESESDSSYSPKLILVTSSQSTKGKKIVTKSKNISSPPTLRRSSRFVKRRLQHDESE